MLLHQIQALAKPPIKSFQYSIDGYFQNHFTGLTAGTYTPLLSDMQRCTDKDSIVVGEPTPMVIDLTVIQFNGAAGLSKGSLLSIKLQMV
jgi:hypothetical protein